MRQGFIETKLAKGIAAGSLTALGLLATSCGNEHKTARVAQEHGFTPNDSSSSASKPNKAQSETAKRNNTSLNMSINLCANKAIEQAVTQIAGVSTVCSNIQTSGGFQLVQGKGHNIPTIVSSSWDNQKSEHEVQVGLEQLEDDNSFLYWGAKAVGATDEPIGNIPCVLQEVSEISTHVYQCFLNQHNLVELYVANNIQVPISSYKSIVQVVIAEAIK